MNIFVDLISLENGSRFDQAFASALVHSTVAVPVVSFDALERLATHQVEIVLTTLPFNFLIDNI